MDLVLTHLLSKRSKIRAAGPFPASQLLNYLNSSPAMVNTGPILKQTPSKGCCLSDSAVLLHLLKGIRHKEQPQSFFGLGQASFASKASEPLLRCCCKWREITTPIDAVSRSPPLRYYPIHHFCCQAPGLIRSAEFTGDMNGKYLFPASKASRYTSAKRPGARWDVRGGASTVRNMIELLSRESPHRCNAYPLY